MISQSLLEPIIFQLPPANERLMIEALPVLDKFGFQVEEFGSHSFRIRAIPEIFTGKDPTAAVRWWLKISKKMRPRWQVNLNLAWQPEFVSAWL